MVRVRRWERQGCIITTRAEPSRSLTSRLLPHDGSVVGLASRVRLEAEMEVGFPWTSPCQVRTPRLVPSAALYSCAEQDLRLFTIVSFVAHAVVDVHSSGR